MPGTVAATSCSPSRSRPPPRPTSRSSSSAPTTRSSPRATTARASRCPARQDELVQAALAAQPAHRSSSSTPAPRCSCPGSTRCRAVLWAWLGGQEWPEALADVLTGVTEPAGRLPWTLPGARVRRARCRDAIPVDGVVEYHEGLARRVPRRGSRLGRTPARAVRSRPGLDRVGVRRRDAGRRARRDGVVLDVVVPQHRAARRARGRAGLRRAPGPTAAPERPVRWLGGFAVVTRAPGAHVRVQVRVRRARVPTWDLGTARLGDPARYLPDPRRPVRHATSVSRSTWTFRGPVHRAVPAPVALSGQPDQPHRSCSSAVRATRSRPQAPRQAGPGERPASPDISARRHSVRIRKLSTMIAGAATLALLATACSGGGGGSDDPSSSGGTGM